MTSNELCVSMTTFSLRLTVSEIVLDDSKLRSVERRIAGLM